MQHWSLCQLKEMESALFSVNRCVFYVCVCVWVWAWQKQWGDKRTQPCLELCHFVISHYFMLSVCSLHLSSHYLFSSWQFSLFICFFGLLTAKLLPQSIHSTAHKIQHRNILVGKRMHQKVHLRIFNYLVRQQVFIQGLSVRSWYNM